MSKYPQEVKQKMVEEVQMIFEKFKNFDENMIPKLKEMRESMSFWQESWKSNEYYRNMIISSKIDEKVKVLKAAVETQYGETTQIKWKLVNKVDYEDMKNWLQDLDNQTWLKIFDKIENF